MTPFLDVSENLEFFDQKKKKILVRRFFFVLDTRGAQRLRRPIWTFLISLTPGELEGIWGCNMTKYEPKRFTDGRETLVGAKYSSFFRCACTGCVQDQTAGPGRTARQEKWPIFDTVFDLLKSIFDCVRAD